MATIPWFCLPLEFSQAFPQPTKRYGDAETIQLRRLGGCVLNSYVNFKKALRK